MFDGVGWAAGEIVVFMLIATLIGFAIGWIFGRWLQKGTIAEEYEAILASERELAKKAETRLAASNTDLDKALLEVKGEQGRLGELTAEFETAQAAVSELEVKVAESGEKDTEIARLSTELAAKAEVEAKLAAESAGKADLEAKLGAAAAAKADLEGKLSTLAHKDAEIERLSAAVDESAGRVAASQERIASLEAELAAAAKAVTVVAEPAPPAVAEPDPEPAAIAEVDPSKEEGLARIAEIAARTAGDGPAVEDDLKKVHGVGPKLERTLKGLGITSFRQIANFQKDDIAYVTAALEGFKGRIERDDWMGSAAEEHLRKYNEPA